MDVITLAAKAQKLKSLIDDPDILVLPNSWDAGSARIVEEAGFPVIATSSGGVAWSMGYPDGEHISRDDMLSVVKRISCSVDLPVTADMETGYGDTPRIVADTVTATLGAGAVGANFEDSQSSSSGRKLRELEDSVERIKAARAAAVSAGVHFVINARTDTFHGGGNDQSFADAVRRGNAYMQAGADCIFIPFLNDIDIIKRLVNAIQGPINILAGASAPTVPDLEEAGVARVSIGGLFSLLSYSHVRTACRKLKDEGTFRWAEDALAHPEMNGLMVPG
ncbi:MAG: isocitrate lyase/phosphoenolpyruvate mutase family protein [Pseudomonadota bacterium]|nr:isocitrate lyase/phosphoenolpyruvate mutase family protein [Pseudomonadota bacterium]